MSPQVSSQAGDGARVRTSDPYKNELPPTAPPTRLNDADHRGDTKFQNKAQIEVKALGDISISLTSCIPFFPPDLTSFRRRAILVIVCMHHAEPSRTDLPGEETATTKGTSYSGITNA